jgi:AcrR family transcriptional regulator
LLASEDQPAKPVQQRSRDKRDQLLAAGLALFGEKGYEAAPVDEIAARAGVAVGGFYQHFHGKRQLLLVLMDDLLDRLSRLDLRPAVGAAGAGGAVREPPERQDVGTDVQAALGSLLQRAFATDLSFAGAYRAWREAVLIDGGLALYQEQIERWTRARVGGVLALLQRLPGARTDVDLPVLARLMDRLFWDLLGQALRLSTEERKRVLAAITHMLYHALFTDA